MCGATQQQTEIEAAQASFYNTLTEHYNELFAGQKEIIGALTKEFMPALAKGPDQEGFGTAEKTALETQATEGTARGFKQAEQYARESQAANSGDVFIPSGQAAAIDAGLASTAESTRSMEENQIIEADYAQGRHNYEFAAGELSGAAALENPTGAAGVANSGGSAAAETANEIAAANNSIWNAAIGGLSGIAGEAVKGWAGKP